MFAMTTARAQCGLDSLEAALVAGQEGAAAGQTGNADHANERLSTAEDEIEEYRTACKDA